ncbi:transmembrane 4 L6 family member 4-like [Glossophaga mutica]
MFLDLKHNDCCGCCGTKSCGNRFAMFSSVIFAVIGFLGAGYSFIISLISIRKGPKCLMDNNEWGYPFHNGDYLTDKSLWSKCREPEDVVSWNLNLFFMLLVIAVIQIVLCAIQVVNGLLGTVCVNCCKGLTLAEHDSDVDTTLHLCQPHLTPQPSAAAVLLLPYMRSKETEAQRGSARSPRSQSSSGAELALNTGHLAPELPPMPPGSPALSPKVCPSAALQL